MTDRGIWAPERRLLSVGLLALVTAGAFEGMAVPTVLPALVADLGGLDLYGWAFSAFWLTNIIGITLSGSDTDRRGPARPFVIGAVLFAAGLVVAGVATDMSLVIVGRAIQGFGSGAIASVVYAVIARAYPAEVRPRMIALVSSAWVVPGLVGPAAAGWVTEAASWRWVFLGVAPPVLLTAAALWQPLVRIGRARRDAPSVTDRRRLIASVGLAIGSTGLLAGLTLGSILPAALLAVAGASLAILAVGPLVPAGMLRLAAGRPAAVAAVFLIGFAFFGTEAFVPLAVVEVRGGTILLGGVALSAAAVTWAAGSWLQARAASSGVRRPVVVGGAALIGLGIAIISAALVRETPIVVVAIGWAVAGLGMGLAYSMLTLLVLESATPGEEGFSSAALTLMFTLGTALGAGAGGAVVALADRGVLALAAAVGIVNLLMLVVALGAVATSLRVPPRGPGMATRPATSGAGMPIEHP